jgi:hypothetical protein
MTRVLADADRGREGAPRARTAAGRLREPIIEPMTARTVRARVALCLFAWLASGCVRLPHGTTAPIRREAALRHQAEEDLGGCADVEITRLDPRAVEVVGCGRGIDYSGASSWTRMPSIALRARNDLHCRDVQIESPAPRIRAVSGCGRTVRYDLACSDQDCAWEPTAHEGCWRGATASTSALPGPRHAMTSDPDPYGTDTADDTETLAVPAL